MPNCAECSESRKELATIPVAVHETEMTRAERNNKRLWVLLLVTILLLVGSNVAWVIYESQFEYVEETQIEQDTDGGGNNYAVGGDYNGKAENNNP